MAANEILRLEGISKEFPGVKALDNVDFQLKSGEVHALIGENGAGKSTLIKILMGVYIKDRGRIVMDGQEVAISNPLDAQKLGLTAVYQEVNLAPHLSIAENFFLGKLPTANGFVDWKKVYKETSEALKKIGLTINPRIKMRDIPVSQQEMISIAKMVFDKMRVIVFDEPTALLTTEETEKLFEIITNLKQEGVGIVYISHRLEEIFRICDTVTVLRDGKKISTCPIGEVTVDNLISKMVGRDLGQFQKIKHPEKGEEVLSVANLTREPAFRNVSFSLHKGEILGMFGLLGSGRTEIVRCIFGADAKECGEICIDGKKKNIKYPLDAIRTGLGLLPENRRTQGLAYQLSVAKNINLGLYKKITRFRLIQSKKENVLTNKYIQELRIKTPTIYQKVKNLSGGNQQKVVISKLLNAESKIFIFDEPTVGIDVGAKQEIYKLIEDLVNKGSSMILISSYLPEIMGIADRILVMYEGKCMGIVDTNEATEEDILRLASGIAGK
jgi:ribose transport system ATP-binding protein